jgi:hypothetical protein
VAPRIGGAKRTREEDEKEKQAVTMSVVTAARRATRPTSAARKNVTMKPRPTWPKAKKKNKAC